MYIRLIRNEAKGNAITGRLVIDGKCLCDTLERKGYEILALCYRVQVTMSPKFKRLMPLVCGVPRTMSNVESQKSKVPRTMSNVESQKSKVNETSAAVSPDFKHSTLDIKQSALRSGIRFHAGWKPEHSTGCILVPDRATEDKLTQIILKAQKKHEEIILEVTDYKPGTEYGYNHPCERELQQHEIYARRAEQRYYELHPEERKG